MPLNPTVEQVTERIRQRSRDRRRGYLERCRLWSEKGPGRAHLSCSNLAHATAALGAARESIAKSRSLNLGIVTAYNDMLSAHQPYETYPQQIREAVQAVGCTAQVAGGVPAMCDGVTQGQPGMQLSLFSRDVIAMAAGVALSHNCFDAAVFLGICDKIVPGLVIAAASFGHLPAVFLPGGPMPSGLSNPDKQKVRERYAKGEVSREELLEAEMASFHAPGTCTFYGTANSNQMLMEFMGLQLPGSSFVNPGTPLRRALTAAGARRALELAAKGNDFTPVSAILDERAFVNGIVGLHATGGSTNHLIHLVAMARAAGILLTWQDFSELSAVTPLMARVYPNGLADVNHFTAAGGLGFLIGELLAAGLLHEEVRTVAGLGLGRYTQEPRLDEAGDLRWVEGPRRSLDPKVLRPFAEPFQATGGLRELSGNLGTACIKVSAVKEEHQVIEAPVRVFDDQDQVKAAFRAGELTGDVVCVVRFQGPKANGMPELHSLTPLLGVLQDRGLKVALVTDGRMSGASGKVPAAIHLSPEALDGGPIARLRDGDRVRLDAPAGRLEVLVPAEEWAARPLAAADLEPEHSGLGRELFAAFRSAVGSAETGAAVAV